MDALIIALDVLIGSAWIVCPILAARYGTLEPEPAKMVDGFYPISRETMSFVMRQL